MIGSAIIGLRKNERDFKENRMSTNTEMKNKMKAMHATQHQPTI